MTNKKYELIPDDTIVIENKTLHSIRACGYIETEDKMNNKKYELIPNDTITREGKTLHRIRALKDFEIITGKTITAGTLGGYIETEDNLSHSGEAWVDGNACVTDCATVGGCAIVRGDAYVADNACVTDRATVRGNASVRGNACVTDRAYVTDCALVHGAAQVLGDGYIYGNADITGNAYIESKQDILVIDNIGSRNGTTTFYKTSDGGIGVTCGCFSGTIDEFAAAVKKTHGDNKYGREYRTTIELAKIHIETENREGKHKNE